MADSLRGILPPIYQHILPDFFDRPKVEEKRANCDRCSMCDHGDPSPVPMEFFNSETKCCTFWPNLPNYLVGAILADESPEMAEGRKRVRAQIASRIGVAPIYMSRPRKWSLLMVGYAEAFGRTRTLKCPYYDDNNPAGACSIWRHRETICLTYYCKYSGGMRGYEFWTALKNYLGSAQRILAKSAAMAIDKTVIEPVFKRNTLTLEDMEDRAPKESDYKAWWGNWVGREEEFYLRCHEWVKNVGPAAYARNVDQTEEGKKFFDELVSKYELLENKILPKNLVRNARMKENHIDEKVVVTTYHRYDSFSLDKDLFEVVGMFKADQTLDENLERLKREEGIELTPELIEFLYATGVLIEPTQATVARAKEPDAATTGELNGRRAALRAILEVRGLTVDDAGKAKIEEGDVAKLDLWIKKAAVAASVADVLAD